MIPDFTVVIPTYNGAARLPDLLAHLRAQTEVADVAWEILIVDNNSSDSTRQVVERYQADATFPVPVRYAFEPRQGAAYARLTAMNEVHSEWVGFLDDDNWPEPTWLRVAVDFCQHSPRLGAFSGRIKLATTAAVPPDFGRIAIFLAIRDHGSAPKLFEPDQLLLPPAASLVIRRQAWQDCVPAVPSLSGKRAGFFVQGDDYEPLLHLHKAGWEIWYTPDLVTHHQVPPSRFERDYLISLAHACGLATCQLRLINSSPAQQPQLVARTILGGVKRSLRLLLTHRQQVYQDLGLRTELAFHWGTILSPWITWRLRQLGAPTGTTRQADHHG